MATAKKNEPKARTTKIVQVDSPQPYVYYANNHNVNHTKRDVQIKFGHTIVPMFAGPPPSQIEVVMETIILLNLGEAQSLCRSLTNHLQWIENQPPATD